jgi:formylglycine-generating enzyme required for sulfatase activity
MQGYVAWLNDKVGADLYRLPTEVEWEYAARAGTKTRFAQGDTLTRKQANFAIFWAEQKDGKIEWHYDPSNERRPISVDRLDAANGWGLRHMAGNVMEVTRSCGVGLHQGYETSSQYLAESYARLTCDRVKKDCFYLLDAELCRPARRVATAQEHWSNWVGFRVVRQMPAGRSE